jgi:ribosomal protein S12 methylthiotransferase
MLGDVHAGGHEVVDRPERADVIVVNTCGFIDAAREESVDTILEMAQFKSDGSCEKLIVTGCLSQLYPNELASEIPEIDHLLGSADYAGFQRAVAGDPVRAGRNRLPVIEVSDTPSYLYDHTSPRLVSGYRHSVYVKIAEGCDRPCSFCIIPRLRGPQRSRSIASVVTEVERLVSEGAREINLVAQDLTRYGVDRPERPTLATLLQELENVRELRWVRLHYTYPTAFSDELIEVIAASPVVVPYIDVPLQHIDDQLLKLMRRGHSARVTRDLIHRLRSRIRQLVLRTTFIVGHPGESDAAFARLRAFVGEIEFERVGVFVYSNEPGTVSADLSDPVPNQVALERQAELMGLQRLISRRKLAALIGSELQVMVDGPSTDSELLLEGRYYGQAPEIDGTIYLTDGSAATGAIVSARVTDSSDYDLVASLEVIKACSAARR